MRRRKQNCQGQSLFELIVAVAVISMFLIALVSAVNRSIASSTFSRQKSSANRYVQEGIEWVRRVRDSNWVAFFSFSSSGGSRYCINDLNFVSGSCSGVIPGTSFSREIVLTSSGSNKVTASVYVYWESPTGAHESKSDVVLTNWKGE
jgi:type II secretory pathway pseudopilin PulG